MTKVLGFRSTGFVSVLCTGILLLAGCLKTSDPGATSSAGSTQGSGGITSSQRMIYSDTSVTFNTVAGSSGNFSWQVKSEFDGVDLTSKCRQPDLAQPGRLECNQLPAGGVIVSVNGSWIKVNVLDPGRGNLAPVLVCDVLRVSSGNQKIGRISSDFTREERRTPATEGDQVRFECLPSSDEQGANSLVYEIVENAGLANERTQRLAGGLTNGSVFAGAPGSVPFLIRATDTQGRTSEARFDLLVACAGPNDLVVAPEGDVALRVDPIGGPMRSFYRFDATRLITSPRGNPLLYQFDFNGDGAMDAHPEGGIIKTWLSSGIVEDVYVAFAAHAPKTREVRVQVRDTVCNYFKEASVPKEFPAQRLSPGQSDQTGGNFLVQADISPLNAAATGAEVIRATKVDLQMWQTPQDPRKPYVSCTWNRGTPGNNNASITINGIHNYFAADPANKRAGASTDHLHGLSFTFEQFPHIPMNSPISYSRTDANSVLRSMSYLSAPGFENLPPRLEYRALGSACTFSVRLETAPSAGTCTPQGSTTPVQTYALIVRGDYDCPSLSTTTAPVRTIEVKRGVFYCEARMTDMCVGGGGGGGDPIQGI